MRTLFAFIASVLLVFSSLPVMAGCAASCADDCPHMAMPADDGDTHAGHAGHAPESDDAHVHAHCLSMGHCSPVAVVLIPATPPLTALITGHRPGVEAVRLGYVIPLIDPPIA